MQPGGGGKGGSRGKYLCKHFLFHCSCTILIEWYGNDFFFLFQTWIVFFLKLRAIWSLPMFYQTQIYHFHILYHLLGSQHLWYTQYIIMMKRRIWDNYYFDLFSTFRSTHENVNVLKKIKLIHDKFYQTIKDKITTLHFFLMILHDQISGSVYTGTRIGQKYYHTHILYMSI